MPSWRIDTTTNIVVGVLIAACVALAMSILPPHTIGQYRTNRNVSPNERLDESPTVFVFFDPTDDSFESKAHILRIAYHSLYLQEQGVRFVGVAVGEDATYGVQPLHEGTSVGGWDLPFPITRDLSGQLQRFYGVYPYEDVWVVVATGSLIHYRACLDLEYGTLLISEAIVSALLALEEGFSIAKSLDRGEN